MRLGHRDDVGLDYLWAKFIDELIDRSKCVDGSCKGKERIRFAALS